MEQPGHSSEAAARQQDVGFTDGAAQHHLEYPTQPGAINLSPAPDTADP